LITNFRKVNIKGLTSSKQAVPLHEGKHSPVILSKSKKIKATNKIFPSYGFLWRLADVSATCSTARQANIFVALVGQAADKIQLFLAVHGFLYYCLFGT
jgi:hypothetical protein